MYNYIIDTASSKASSVSGITDNTDSSDVTIDIAENDVSPAEHIIDIDNDVSIYISSPAGQQTDTELPACPTELVRVTTAIDLPTHHTDVKPSAHTTSSKHR